MPTYLIPGLGFDHRIFSKLDMPWEDVHYRDWIKPKAGEGIREYARRFSEGMEDNAVLVGHSFGGIISQEIAAIRPASKVILISSIKSRKELPGHFRMIQPLGIHRILSKTSTMVTFPLWAKFHDYQTKEEQALFKDMVNKHSNADLRWALAQLSSWKGVDIKATECIHIHGDRDHTFPMNKIHQPCEVISGGGHFMVYRMPTAISEQLAKVM